MTGEPENEPAVTLAEEPEKGGSGRVYTAMRALLVLATTAASAVGGLLTVALLSIGLSRMLSGVLRYAGLLAWEVEPESPSSAALEMCLSGIEFFFLAPLPFLLPLSLARYIRDSREDRDERASKADLLSVKALTTALLIAVLASSLVGEALGPDGLHYEGAISASLVIAVLGTYFFSLEWQARVQKP